MTGIKTLKQFKLLTFAFTGAVFHTVFPVQAIHLALYLQHRNSTGSKTAVEEAVYALAWIHQAAGLPSPANDPNRTGRPS